MLIDFNDTAVEEAKTSKRRWLWGSLGFALAAWLAVWWISSHQLSVTLPDGRVVRYDKIIKGTRVSESEFESDAYAYSEESFYPLLVRIIRSAARMIPSSGKSYPARYVYRQSPELLILSSSERAPSMRDVSVLLDDGFGKKQTMGAAYEYEPFYYNNGQLPMGSASWNIDFHDKSSRSLGEFNVPNPLFKTVPRFTGNSPPMEAKNSKRVLKLLSATCSTSEQGQRRITLEFSASSCSDLLPCHVIGIRIYDSWDNTELHAASFDQDGKIIRMTFNTVMQSEDWRIRIALCRGRGAKFADSEIARYDRFLTTNYRSIPTMRTIRGRELMLSYGSCGGSGVTRKEWRDCFLKWQLDQKGPLLWPVLVNAIGRTTEGATVDVVPVELLKKNPSASYRVKQERFVSGFGDGAFSLTKDTLFHSGFSVPPDVEDFDLHIALEEPQVFEFFAKISNWPTASTKTVDTR